MDDIYVRNAVINNLKTVRLRQNIILQRLFTDAAGVLVYSETGSENETEISFYRIIHRSYYTLQPGILPSKQLLLQR